MRPKLALVDGDEIFYRYTSAHEHEVPVSAEMFYDAWLYEEELVLLSDVEQAYKDIKEHISSIALHYKRTIVCFTSTPTFRHEVLDSYKGGRLKKRKPIGYWKLINRFISESDCGDARKEIGLEADDLMSIIATNPKCTNKYDVTIHSQDKDMLQVPDVTVVRQGVEHKTHIADANMFRYTQALTGDVTDGYKGLPGVGPKKAEKILSEYWGESEQTLQNVVIDAYDKAGYDRSCALQQINCARILRHHEVGADYKPFLVE